jgi:hypothetical protein
MRSQEPAIGFYENWTAHPKDEDEYRNAKDIAAGHPHYSHIDNGLRSLIESIFDDVKTHKRVKDYSDLALKTEILEILCSVPTVVLRGICGAGLQARKIRDEELYAWLSNNLRNSTDPTKRSCIYVLELTSSRGRPPTLGHMREFARCARAYLKPSSQADFDIIVRVDEHCTNHFDSDDEDERRSLATRTWLPTPVRGKNLKRLGTLLDELDKRIDEFSISNGDNIDFPHPLRDVGYSDDSLTRLEQQETLSQSSNRFLSLFNAIAQSHPDDAIQKRHYRAWGNVVFLGFRTPHAMLGEIVFSVLAQSYHWTGKGFNSVDAGVQNTSNDKYTFAQFAPWREEIFETSPYKANAAAEIQRADDLLAEGSRIEREEEDFELEALRQSLSALYVVEDQVDAFERAVGELS